MLAATALISAVAAILQMEHLSRIIDGAFLQGAGLAELRTPVWWLTGAICLRVAALWLSELASQEIAASVKEELRNRLLRSLTKSGPLLTQREKTGELAACIVEGVERLDAWYAKFLPHGLAMAIVPATLTLFVLWFDWPSGIVLILTGPLILVFMVLIGMMAQRKTRQQWIVLSRMSGHFLDVLQGLPTLHLFGRSSVQSANISRVSQQFRRATMQVLSVAFLSGFVLELVASISTALVALEIGLRLIGGLIDFQRGLLVLLLAPEFYLPFRQFGASHHAGMEGAAAGERIFELLDEERRSLITGGTDLEKNRWIQKAGELSCRSVPLTESAGAALPLIRPIQIQFQNVDYQYPGTDTPAISGLTFNLEPGRIHLLAGDNGAGKSTVMKLLLRFIQPTGGAVTVNNKSLHEIPAELWRGQVAFVSQHPHFFEGSVLENLCVACPGATLEKVRAAARLAEADEFVMALPRRYDTPISEAAARFSGGERQRLAITRAFLKESTLLLFDEPTSHLDAATAMEVQRAFLRLACHRTTLVVAHHGFALSDADVVFVLSRGHLVESIERSSLGRSINAQHAVKPAGLEVQTR